jgi:hypothetical protein
VPQRIRGIVGGETVVDSTDVKLLHATGHLPVYSVRDGLLQERPATQWSR